jgi:hypothetical protein
MNYTKIYKTLMERAKSENRKKGNSVYYESHHIIPDFMFKERRRKGPKGHLAGDPNDKKNLVLLTEREHILSHILLSKSLNGKRYWAQASSSLVWFYTKVNGEHPRQQHRIAGTMRKYERYRSLGLAGISAARKGTFPAVDFITRKSVGSVSNQHPKVLSGEWVHHSTGRIVPESKKGIGTQYYGVGTANSNYKEMTEERKQRVFSLIPLSCYNDEIGDKIFLGGTFEMLLKGEFVEFKKISRAWIRNNFGKTKDLLEMYNTETNSNIIFKPYGKSCKSKESNYAKNKKN